MKLFLLTLTIIFFRVTDVFGATLLEKLQALQLPNETDTAKMRGAKGYARYLDAYQRIIAELTGRLKTEEKKKQFGELAQNIRADFDLSGGDRFEWNEQQSFPSKIIIRVFPLHENSAIPYAKAIYNLAFAYQLLAADIADPVEVDRCAGCEVQLIKNALKVEWAFAQILTADVRSQSQRLVEAAFQVNEENEYQFKTLYPIFTFGDQTFDMYEQKMFEYGRLQPKDRQPQRRTLRQRFGDFRVRCASAFGRGSASDAKIVPGG